MSDIRKRIIMDNHIDPGKCTKNKICFQNNLLGKTILALIYSSHLGRTFCKVILSGQTKYNLALHAVSAFHKKTLNTFAETLDIC